MEQLKEDKNEPSASTSIPRRSVIVTGSSSSFAAPAEPAKNEERKKKRTANGRERYKELVAVILAEANDVDGGDYAYKTMRLTADDLNNDPAKAVESEVAEYVRKMWEEDFDVDNERITASPDGPRWRVREGFSLVRALQSRAAQDPAWAEYRVLVHVIKNEVSDGMLAVLKHERETNTKPEEQNITSFHRTVNTTGWDLPVNKKWVYTFAGMNQRNFDKAAGCLKTLRWKDGQTVWLKLEAAFRGKAGVGALHFAEYAMVQRKITDFAPIAGALSVINSKKNWNSVLEAFPESDHERRNAFLLRVGMKLRDESMAFGTVGDQTTIFASELEKVKKDPMYLVASRRKRTGDSLDPIAPCKSPSLVMNSPPELEREASSTPTKLAMDSSCTDLEDVAVINFQAFIRSLSKKDVEKLAFGKWNKGTLECEFSPRLTPSYSATPSTSNSSAQ